MERRDFSKSAADMGAGSAAGTTAGTAAGAVGNTSVAEATKGKPKRGVSVYSYSRVLGACMTLEDAFADIHDMGATRFELLTSHIDNYPNPSTQWIDHYWALCEKYKLHAAELGIWAETHLHRGPKMTDDQVVLEVTRDLKLANLLGFDSVRLKLTCMNVYCDPEPGWESYMERLLPVAEKLDVAMLSECHAPTGLSRPHISQYLEFADKHKTKYFGINCDFSTFQNAWPEDVYSPEQMAYKRERSPGYVTKCSDPEEIVRVLPYSRTCHAKFNFVDESFHERTIPYEKVLQIMVDQGWNGTLISEYEGPKKSDPGFLGDQLRRHHIMMQRILGS